jgi:hypothetical protein
MTLELSLSSGNLGWRVLNRYFEQLATAITWCVKTECDPFHIDGPEGVYDFYESFLPLHYVADRYYKGPKYLRVFRPDASLSLGLHQENQKRLTNHIVSQCWQQLTRRVLLNWYIFMKWVAQTTVIIFHIVTSHPLNNACTSSANLT